MVKTHVESTTGYPPHHAKFFEDGVRLHESVKVKLETFARETGNTIVKPFWLVIARDTTTGIARNRGGD